MREHNLTINKGEHVGECSDTSVRRLRGFDSPALGMEFIRHFTIDIGETETFIKQMECLPAKAKKEAARVAIEQETTVTLHMYGKNGWEKYRRYDKSGKRISAK